MRIAIVGTGYVGLVSAAGWAALGHDVTCIDIDTDKVKLINKGVPPIFEIGLSETLQTAIRAGKLRATTNYSLIRDSEVIFIAVGTPSKDDGSMDVRHIQACSESIARELEKKKHFVVVAIRSTVLPGTTEKIVGEILEKAGFKRGVDFGLAMVPEFLKEGTALEDFQKPDRVIIGCSDDKTRNVFEKMYQAFNCPKQFTSLKTAEMIKYASNAMLATKLSFTNEISAMCEKLGIDVDSVMNGVGLDRRIGPLFLIAGAGFGGSCFPKDVKALIHKSNELGVKPRLLESVMDVNMQQQKKLVAMLKESMDIRGKSIAILGLAFKNGTDDVRESSAVTTIKMLLDGNAKVRACDPQAIESMKKIFPESAQMYYTDDWGDCLKGCHAALLITAWPEFRKNALEYKKALGNAPLIDARRVLPAGEAERNGLKYYCIGRG